MLASSVRHVPANSRYVVFESAKRNACKQQAEDSGFGFPSKEFAGLEHADFLKKVPIVLGVSVAGNFSGYYKARNGKQNPMYTFPKREACLMAKFHKMYAFNKTVGVLQVIVLNIVLAALIELSKLLRGANLLPFVRKNISCYVGRGTD
ncbi:MAG: hypothetical protein Q8S26_01870 [Azonexus sp.]|nr:hypothetical protein [Azonexus sp.]